MATADDERCALSDVCGQHAHIRHAINWRKNYVFAKLATNCAIRQQAGAEAAAAAAATAPKCIAIDGDYRARK